MTTADLPSIAKVAEMLGGEVRGDHVHAPGPGHSAGDRSLSVLLDSRAPGGFVVNSFAGDDAIVCRDHVRDRLGLPPFEAKKKANGNANGKWSPPLAEFIYRDAKGEPYLLVRKHLDGDGKKQFPQFHWDGTQWLKGKPAGPKIPYRLPELLAAPTAAIHIVEGEKDADALANACLVATTASEGAGAKWPPELTEYFKGRRIVILPDADEPGRKHGQKVAKALYDVAASVKVVDLFPDRSDGHDVSDWLKHDTVGAKLFNAIKAAPEWRAAKRRRARRRGGGIRGPHRDHPAREAVGDEVRTGTQSCGRGAWRSGIYPRSAGAGRKGAPWRRRRSPPAGTRGRAARAEAVRGSSGRREPAR